MSPIKVTIVGKYPMSEIYGGAAVYMYQLTQHIQCYDIELHVVTFGSENKEFSAGNVHIHVIKREKIFELLPFNILLVSRLRCKIREIDSDIVHCFGTFDIYPIAVATLIDAYPTTITAFGLIKEEIKYEYYNRGIIQSISTAVAKLIERYSIRRIPNIIVETKSIKYLISSMTNSNIYVVPDGVEYERIQQISTNPSKTSDILFVGRLHRINGVDILIDAIHSIVKLNFDLNVCIIGSGKEENELKSNVKKLDLEKYIKFIGFVSENEKYQYFKASKIVVIPCRWSLLPITMLEAMACGKPVIASNVAGIPDVVEDGEMGFLFESENVEDLANKIIKLLKDEKLRNKMGELSRERAKEYGWDKIAKRIVEIYREILSKRT